MQLDVEINPFRRWMLVIGPLLAAAAGIGLCLGGHSSAVCWTAAITVLCAAWWVTEALPIPATSLIPLALLPLTGVLDQTAVSNAYGHYLILLLMGGFMLSKAMEKTGTQAHRPTCRCASTPDGNSCNSPRCHAHSRCRTISTQL